jgi:hypothetical protein
MNSEFEGKLLLFRVLVPLVFGALSAWFLRHRLELPATTDGESGPEAKRPGARGLGWALGCVLVWIAFWVSELGSRGILLSPQQWSSWEARERWMHWVWIGPLVLSNWIALKAIMKSSPSASAVIALFMALTMALMAWFMFPDGSGYADQRTWFFVLSLLSLVFALSNRVLVHWRQETPGSVWFGWVHVMHLGCVAAVVLQSYASLGEWMVFSGSMMAGVMLVLGLSKQAWCELSLTPLLAFSAVAGLSLSRAYSWSPLPTGVLVLLLGFPSLAALVDGFVCRFLRGSVVGRVAILFVILGIALGIIYAFVVRNEPQW